MTSVLASRLRLKHLRLIATIAELRQLSLAATALAITQPAASRTLAEAEAQVGAALFRRTPKGMELTDVGESLARRARNILDELNDAADEVERLRLGRGGAVRIGAVTGAAVGYVAPAIRQLVALAPDVELQIDVGTSDELMTGLLALHHDMVLARVPAWAAIEGLLLHPARGEQVRFLAQAAHPASRRDSVRLTDLADHEWVMQSKGAPIRRAVEQAFLAQAALLPRRVTNTSSLVMTLALLQSPDVVTPVSQEVAALLTAGHSNLAVLPVQETIVVAPYFLITLRERRLSPAATRCRDLLAALVGSGAAG